MGEPVKGTVTSLSSIFAPEDAQKASVHVQQVISQRQKKRFNSCTPSLMITLVLLILLRSFQINSTTI
ncbi:hypothetical protein Hdeb2414_s0006g00195801 [Helianthus debilis subsp. tardiflorus]